MFETAECEEVRNATFLTAEMDNMICLNSLFFCVFFHFFLFLLPFTVNKDVYIISK